MHLLTSTTHILFSKIVFSGQFSKHLPLYWTLYVSSFEQSSMHIFFSLINNLASSGHCKISRHLYCPKGEI